MTELASNAAASAAFSYFAAPVAIFVVVVIIVVVVAVKVRRRVEGMLSPSVPGNTFPTDTVFAQRYTRKAPDTMSMGNRWSSSVQFGGNPTDPLPPRVPPARNYPHSENVANGWENWESMMNEMDMVNGNSPASAGIDSTWSHMKS